MFSAIFYASDAQNVIGENDDMMPPGIAAKNRPILSLLATPVGKR
jgi:hypothetical protein